MRAMVLEKQKQAMKLKDVDEPEPGEGQIKLHVLACGVCRTDLHIFDGDLKNPKLPLIMGHQIVGKVEKLGKNTSRFKEGDRVGVPWLGYTDDTCEYCKSGRENLCDNAKFTGYDMDGGYAEKAVADERYCFPIPDGYPDLQAAPLLCAGLIGYRAYRLAGEGKRIGFYGFGSSASILVQLAVHEGHEVYAFTKEGDTESQEFAKKLGAAWAGSSKIAPPEPLHNAIVFAPVGPLMVSALRVTKKGGNIVSAGIHMSDIPAFPYDLLWEERTLKSVANLTREDGHQFLQKAPKVPIHTEVKTYELEDANQALDDIRSGNLTGSAVLIIDKSATHE
ncbi:MAG: zinc-dependent alcohol dehydrogenase family protein [Candidatus Zixiibacteriota bacterium]|jgi:propanol-preferring alcohol dehydrogenase